MEEEGLPENRKIPTLSEIIKRLWFICKDHKPQISFAFYFIEDGKPEYITLMNNASIKFKLMCHIIRSKGSLVDDVKKYMEAHADQEPMDTSVSHLENFKKIFDPIQDILTSHCPQCKEKWEGLQMFLTDIDEWSDYVREVKFLRDTIEKQKFCISVREYFPYADELIEYGHEYATRCDNIADLFAFTNLENYYLIVEYWDSQYSKMDIEKYSAGKIAGSEYLDEM